MAQRVEAYLLDAEQGDAVAVMERVVTQSPNVAAYWRDLGYFRGKAWHLRRAAEAFDRALETKADPIDAARVQAQRGQSYFVVSRSAEARAAFERAVALRPDYAPYWAQLCEARLAAGECHTARDAARQSRGVAPNWTAHSCLVRADICLGQVDEGSEEIKGAWGWDLVAIGDFFRSRGDEAKARAAYERAQLPPGGHASRAVAVRSGAPRRRRGQGLAGAAARAHEVSARPRPPGPGGRAALPRRRSRAGARSRGPGARSQARRDRP